MTDEAWLTAVLLENVHPFASVTVLLYPPTGRFLIVDVVPPVFHKKE
jgi:hypothetical protein